MGRIFFWSLLLFLSPSCKKENNNHHTHVDIYLLKSFTPGIDTTKKPAINTITNVVLADSPLVTDDDIKSYTKESHTFILRKNIKSIIQNYGPDKAFAVTVDNQVIYYGGFHPGYLSSLRYGLATIDPILINNKELRIDFVNLTGTFIHELDKRNDSRIINALKATGRLR